MQTPDLTPTAKMAHAICQSVNGQYACLCARAANGRLCETMAETGRKAMIAAGMGEGDVAALLEGGAPKNPPRKSRNHKKGAPKNPPTFNQIQEVMQQMHPHLGPLSGKIAQAALQQYCDFHHPSTPEALADMFWRDDAEFGYTSISEMVNEAAEDHQSGDAFVIRLGRAVALQPMHLTVEVDHDGGHKWLHYTLASTAQARLDLVKE